MKLFTQTFFFLLLTTQICFGQWETTNGPYSSPYDPSVQCFTINGTYIFAGTDVGGVFHSTNNGFNWIKDNSGLTSTDVYALAVIGTNLFAGTAGGVFLSSNNGTSWTDVSSGLINTHVIAFVVYGANLFAGTVGNEVSVWRRPLSEMITSVEGPSKELPTQFALYQNYPNPFNPSTKIKYSIPNTSQVQIKVYDILSNEIETLDNEEKPAGTYEVKWDATKLPSGLYFYQLRAGSFVETKKMILMK